MKILPRLIPIVIVFVLLGLEVLAQAPPPSPPAAGVPLDGFTILLLVAGAGYGIIRIRDYQARE